MDITLHVELNVYDGRNIIMFKGIGVPLGYELLPYLDWLVCLGDHLDYEVKLRTWKLCQL